MKLLPGARVLLDDNPVHLRRFHIPLAAAAAVALTGAGGAALAAGGEQPVGSAAAHPASAAASAYARQDDGGSPRDYARASGEGSDSGAGTAARASTAGGQGSASASARVRDVSIFGGLVKAGSVSVQASANGDAALHGGTVTGLVIDGARRGTITSRRVFDLGGYGKLVVLDSPGDRIIALRAKLTRAYAGYPAGSTVRVASAAATARDAVAPPKPKPRPRPAKPGKEKPKPHAPGAKPKAPAAKPHKAKRRKPPRTKVLLTGKGYVFPVYGKHSYSDDWGAPRQDTGFHQGNDIFAATGTPVVAVCDGTLHRVGTRPVPGNRLWVKCSDGGDAFFYGHLSAFASDAHSGLEVKAGQVVGFVGSTGDAEQTPPHVHFEVHPGDGEAVDPYPFLRAWETHRDVPAAAWVRRNGAGAGEQPGTLVVVRDYLDR